MKLNELKPGQFFKPVTPNGKKKETAESVCVLLKRTYILYDVLKSKSQHRIDNFYDVNAIRLSDGELIYVDNDMEVLPVDECNVLKG